jgi:Zn-finger nucleic acid-binding protein
MALPEGRPAWHCDHCDTTIRLESGPNGVRLVGSQAGPELECPLGHEPLQAAVMDDHYRINACATCRGLLMAREVFAETVAARRWGATTPSVMPKKVSPRQLDRRVHCPSCHATMITDWYYGPGHVVIDRCETCDLVWLDGGELQTILEAPGPDRVL